LQLTRIFANFIHDKDLKLILDKGITTLQNQIKRLENTAVQFEIPLPQKPTACQQITMDPEVMTDKTVYRIILRGIQDAISTHIRAAVETTRNDKVRDLFLQLYKDEVTLYNNFIRYGKIKGWSYIAPKYRKS
jgi:hypothetical protein